MTLAETPPRPKTEILWFNVRCTKRNRVDKHGEIVACGQLLAKVDQSTFVGPVQFKCQRCDEIVEFR